MKIVILDQATLGADIDLSPITALGEAAIYATTPPEEIGARVKNADVVVVNKLKLNESNLKGSRVRLICVAATGYDPIDTEYCKKSGITLCNVPGYSSHSVAQLTVAMGLSLVSHLTEYQEFTRSGEYTRKGIANWLQPVYHEVAGMKWGVVGGGGIGTRVAEIAAALGCKVAVCRRKQEGAFPLEDIDTLCKTCDILSLHIPLTEETRCLINRERIAAMKQGAILLNTARGGVTDEAALAEALQSGHLGGLGIDVYTAEPFGEDHPFYPIRHLPNLLLTPHMAWGSAESRARCVAVMAQNITCFYEGHPQNRIV
ncbi:MAG: hydroxyacid dehydrogenase [Clostridia bacterium]|nr:hydroxyacid dehydrogenase [Clostridia bacterium]